MKLSLSVLALGITLALSGTAMAANYGEVDQNGNDNDAKITQAFNSNAWALIDQHGNDNYARTLQENTGGFAWSKTYQNGTNNDARVRQTDGGNLSAQTTQFGSDNSARTVQTNWNQTAVTYQNGMGNTSVINQQ